MKILHIAPHLGGGVGKAHMALAQARVSREGGDPAAGSVRVHRHAYALLEPPRDLHYAEAIERAGCEIHVLPLPGRLAAVVENADIVQIEWWNHPRLFQWLTQHPLPAMRLAIWVHISGLAPPLVPRTLTGLADKILFTSASSYGAPNLADEIAGRPTAFSVVNSGFGLDGVESRPRTPGEPLRFAYLGTIDFIKMHPDLFDLIDEVGADIRLHLWGRHDPGGEVARRAAAMRHPERVCFEGYTSDAASILAATDVFLYLLAPDHYGTAENALVEAMSAGAVPIVWNNPAEAAIVVDGETGFVVGSRAAFLARMAEIVRDPAGLDRLRRSARSAVARRHAPRASLAALDRAYGGAMDEPKRVRDFRSALGPDARAWFLSSLTDTAAARIEENRLLSDRTSKGSLGHFRLCCPQDDSLAALEARTGRVA